MAEASTNWAGNLHYQAATIHHPPSLAQVQEIVARSRRLKVVGTRHSFNGIADTTGDHVSLERMNRIVALDREARTVTIEGGVRYGELGVYLHREGFALHNLASLPHISVAGAVATATHGSGDRLGNLATAVVALEIVTDDGSVVTFSRREHSAEFAGAVVGLGALGVVTRLTLAIEPTYDVAQLVLEDLQFAEVATHFDAIMSSARSVSLFTDWQTERFHQLWSKLRLDGGDPEPKPAEGSASAPVTPVNRDTPHTHTPVNRVFPLQSTGWSQEFGDERVFGATFAPADRHPIPGHAAEYCTPQMAVLGPWHERLPHFRLEFTPSSGAELQSEYFVPRTHAVAALRALFQMRTEIAPHIFVSEVRTIAADDLWLSPSQGQPYVGFHFTWKPDWPAVRQLLPRIENALAPFEARPHWGKLFTMAPERLRALYPKLPDFLRLRARLDPAGKFRNDFLDQVLGQEQVDNSFADAATR